MPRRATSNPATRVQPDFSALHDQPGRSQQKGCLPVTSMVVPHFVAQTAWPSRGTVPGWSSTAGDSPLCRFSAPIIRPPQTSACQAPAPPFQLSPSSHFLVCNYCPHHHLVVYSCGGPADSAIRLVCLSFTIIDRTIQSLSLL